MNGRNCLVTGATRGIGLHTAIGLAERGASVIVHGRTEASAGAAATAVRQHVAGATVHTIAGDLTAMADVDRLANEVVQRFDVLHVLVNNAGLVCTERALTTDGFERQLAVNHLAPFLLTKRLAPLLTASAPARVVNVASHAHNFGRIHFDDLHLEHSWSNPMVGYRQSKLAMVLSTQRWAQELKNTGVTVNTLHPGVVGTDFANSASSRVVRMGWKLMKPFLKSAQSGAKTTLYACCSTKLTDVTGQYFDKQRPRELPERSRDMTTADRLWDVTEALISQALA